MIDDKAILADQDRRYVYALGPNDKAIRKDVRLGNKFGDLRAIASGLTSSDKVIVDGVQRVFYPGMPVKPKFVPMEKQSVAMAASGVSAK